MNKATQAQHVYLMNMSKSTWTKSVILFFICSVSLSWYFVEYDPTTNIETWQLLPDDALAISTKPNDIISKPLATGIELYTMPKLIHQSWMTDVLPERMRSWSQTCRAQHRHWQWSLWTDEDNRKMVETYFPWFLRTYNALPAEINRADVSRNMYMYLFGGVYADLDTECLQPLDDLFLNHSIRLVNMDSSSQFTLPKPSSKSSMQTAFFGHMGFDGTDDTLQHTIPNAWMASTPGHPIFLLILERLHTAISLTTNDKFNTTAEDLTGPIALYHGIEEYNRLLSQKVSFPNHFASNPSYHLFNRTSPNSQIEVLPPETIYPYSWNNEGKTHRDVCWARSNRFNSAKCKQRVTTDRSYAITYWSHTWNEDLHKEHSKLGLESVG